MRALLKNHTSHGCVATTCTVSSSVASQHRKLWRAPTDSPPELTLGSTEPLTAQQLISLRQRRTTPAS
jgi:hypothetical protein